MRIRIILLAAMVVCWTSYASGEYYQYRDESGVLRFTDDLSSVPPDQRPGLKTHQSIEGESDQLPNTAPVKGNAGTSNASGESESQTADGTPEKQSLPEVAELNRMQVELNQTFKDLRAERSALEAKAPPKNAPSKEKAAHLEQVEAYNAKLADYEAQLEAYNRLVNDYNAQMKK